MTKNFYFIPFNDTVIPVYAIEQKTFLEIIELLSDYDGDLMNMSVDLASSVLSLIFSKDELHSLPEEVRVELVTNTLLYHPDMALYFKLLNICMSGISKEITS